MSTERGSGLLGAALTLIHTGQAPTRSALTAALGVTRATAGAVAAELRDLGLIEVDPASGGGAQGRPSHRLLIDPGGPVALAAHVHPDAYAVALVGLGGHVVARAGSAADMRGDPARALASVAEAGAELLRQSGRTCAGARPSPCRRRSPNRRAPRSARYTWAGRPARRSGTSPRPCSPTRGSACPAGWSTTSTRSRWRSTGTARAGARITCSWSPPSTGASAARSSCAAPCTPAAPACPWRPGTSA